MADWFVRQSTGSDANAGTSAGAAWATIGKAHASGAGPVGGDHVYIGAGTYRETVSAALTSPTSELQYIADVDGAKTGDAGRVVWTAFTTSDRASPSATTTLSLAGKKNLTYQNLYFVGGGTQCIDGNTTNATGITFTNCTIVGVALSTIITRYTALVDTAANWLFDRCTFIIPRGSTGFSITAPTTGGGADYDLNIVFRNCLFLIGDTTFGILGSTTGALANKPGGIVLQNCTYMGGGTAMSLSGANWSTTVPAKVYNNVFIGPTTGLSAGASGQIVEDYNYIQAGNPRTNVSSGTNSVSSTAFAPTFDYDSAAVNGFLCVPALQPIRASAFLGFGNQASAPAPPAVDILGRPRPAGGDSLNNAIGAFERHNTAVRETSTVQAGSNAARISGPGDHDLVIPVSAVSTTITISARYDSNHGATNKPQVILQAAGDIGVSAQTVTMTAAVDTWETLTIGPFTPTGSGFVILRLVSRAAASNGIAFFDSAAVPQLDTVGFDYFRRGELFPALTQGGVAYFPFAPAPTTLESM